jgi:hypothetical protein
MDNPQSEEQVAALAAYAALRVSERRSHRALLRAERRTRHELGLAVNDVLARVHRADDDERVALAEVRRTVPRLALALERAIHRARTLARVDGRASLPFHARSPHPLDARSAHDAARAHTAATSYAAAWGAQATVRILSEEREVRPLAPAPSPDPRLDRIAATETASAFNDERRRLVRDEPLPLGTFRVWSAVLDRATCVFCFQKDGETRGAGETFGASPPVHPNCRCTIEVIFVPHPERLDDVAFDYDLFKREVRDVIRERREVSKRHAVRFVSESTEGARRSPEVLTETFRRGDYRQP